MKIIRNLSKGVAAIALALLLGIGSIYIGANTTEIFASAANTNSEPTVRMGDNDPMTRNEFMEWREQRGIRHFRIEGSILPAEIFFNGYSGRSFNYGELNDRILNVYLIPGVVSSDRNLSIIGVNQPNQETPTAGVLATETPTVQATSDKSPVIFDDLTSPIFFSDEELTAMIERVPHQGPLDIRSAITLPNRRLTEAELEAWINEYNEMGGATAFELGVIREVNRVREQHGLRPLYLCPALMISARFKTQEFGDLQYYSHISPVYGSPSASARMFGFEGSASEAITSAGRNGTPIFRSTPERIVEGMLASSRGHREILLNPRLQSVGFGAFFSPNSTGSCGQMSHMFYFATKFGFIID